MAKRLTKILILAIALVMCLGLFAGCGNPTFSEEDHIQRISERVQSRFFADGSEYAELYTDFSIELLYNAKDEPAYFLIEFEPSGFLYGIIDKKDYYFDNGRMGTTNIGTSYWQGGTFFRGSQWGETGEGWWKPSEFVSDYLHWGKQGKHILGHNNFIPGRSPITIPKEKLQELFNEYRGTGEREGSKELVNFNKVIGQVRNPETGEIQDTTWGNIHYDNDGGWHIVPSWKE